MLSKLIVITSLINPREGSLTYSQKRSHFNAEERFHQTIFTVNSLRNSLPEAKIVIVDSSDNYSTYQFTFNQFENVEFIPIKELSGEAHEIINTHNHKSHCESVLLQTYFKQYKKTIKEYDFIFKTSGRYFHFNFNDKYLTGENKNRIFFKKPMEFEWQDRWGYEFVDLRHEEQRNILKQYSTVLYGYGSEHLEKFMDINEATIHFTKYASMSHYDIETLYYYFMRPYKDLIFETDWQVAGWLGASGQFVHY